MGKQDPRVDAYIQRAAPFARPILEHLRELFHRGCPAVVETIKWGAPHFEHKGLLAGMAAFKEHATFGFWKGSQVTGSDARKEAMGQFGRLRALADLPPDDEILGWVRVAARLNESGIRVPKPLKHPRVPIPVPADLAAALAREEHARARATFESFSPSHRREYLEWITEAKTEATRARRLAATLELLAEGKARNWKYASRPPAPDVESEARTQAPATENPAAKADRKAAAKRVPRSGR